MATSREVAEAYIEVHGDLSEFRKDLNDAGDSARKAGEANADSFSDGWNKRIRSEVGDRWEAMLDAMYRDNPIDWNKLIGKFDTTDLDRADVQIHDFMRRMREAGKLNETQYDEISKKVRALIKEKQNEIFVQRDLENITRAHTEALQENMRIDALRSAAAQAAAKDIGNAMTESLEKVTKLDKDRANAINEQVSAMEHVEEATRRTVDQESRRPGIISRTVRNILTMKKSTDDAAKSGGFLHTIFDKMHVSWLRMDSTVRTVLGLILAAAGPMAVALSGAAGSATALVSSLGMAVGSVVPLGAAFAGVGITIALAVSAMDDMIARFPAILENANAVGDAWQQQANRFGQEWGPALEKLLATLNERLREFDFGTAFGRSMSKITEAFTAVMSSPAFTAFMRALEGDIPAAVERFGTGIASLSEGLFSMFAAASPIAVQLGQDFANWARQIATALEEGRKSGELTALFGRMRDSLLAVLDLAGSLGSALVTLFDAGSISGNRMIKSLAGIVDQFNAWMKTEAGRATLLEWFNNAERIIRSLEPVIVGLGKALDILVTPFAIAQFENLTGLVGDLLPILAEVLKVISDLGILNILAELLLTVGKAVQPLLPPLGELARTVGPLVQQVFRDLAPILGEVVEAVVPLVYAILGLVKQLAPVLIPAVERLAGALAPLVIKFADLVTVILEKLYPVIGPVLTAYINGSVKAFELLSSVIGTVLDVVTTVISGLVDFFLNLGTNITNFNTTVNQMFTTFWQDIVNGFNGFVAGFQAGWDGFWGGLGTNIANIWLGIQTQFTTGWTQLTSGFTTWVSEFQTGWDTFWNGLGEGLRTIWTGVLTTLQVEWQKIVDGVNNVLIKPFQQFWDAFWNGLDPELKAVIQGIQLSIQKGWQDIQTNLGNFIQDFVNKWNKFWGDVGATNDRKWRETIDGFNRWSSDINNTVNRFVQDVINGWNGMWNDLFSRASNGWNQLIGGFNNWSNDINNTVRGFINGAIGEWNRFWGDMFGRASGGWNQLIGGFNNWANSINGIVNGWINGAISNLNGFWNNIVTVARTMMFQFANDIANRINEAGRFFGQLPGMVGSALAGLANMLYNIGANAIRSLANAIANGAGAIIGAITGAVGGAINAAKRMLGIASPSKVFAKFGEQTGEGYIVGLNSEAGDIRTASERMLDGVFDSFDKSKALAAGQDAGRGIAEGLESSKARIAAAIGKIDPAISSAFTTSVTASGARIGTATTAAAATAEQQGNVIIEEGAIQLVSKATSPELLGGIVLDGLSDLFVARSKA